MLSMCVRPTVLYYAFYSLTARNVRAHDILWTHHVSSFLFEKTHTFSWFIYFWQRASGASTGENFTANARAPPLNYDESFTEETKLQNPIAIKMLNNNFPFLPLRGSWQSAESRAEQRRWKMWSCAILLPHTQQQQQQLVHIIIIIHALTVKWQILAALIDFCRLQKRCDDRVNVCSLFYPI